MKRKQAKHLLQGKMLCQCCKRERIFSPSEPLLSQEIYLWNEKLNYGTLVENAPKMQWACSECLKSGRAIAANPASQTYCDWLPYLAYFDNAHHCVECGMSFIFSKEEQRYWYEELGFWVQSKPNQCRKCRAGKRKRAQANRDLQKALADLEPGDAFQLAAIAKLYLSLGHQEKASEFLRRAKNRAGTHEQKTELVRQLENLDTAQ